jgi:hypothetical protein
MSVKLHVQQIITWLSEPDENHGTVLKSMTTIIKKKKLNGVHKVMRNVSSDR